MKIRDMNVALIFAGGTGKRMNTKGVPKQFLELYGKPIIIYTIEKFENNDEIGTYYMHGVSHHLGIDVHDVTAAGSEKLQPGAIITDEPGLYIDEWEIGIRIEDDILITEDGCVVLSDAIIRDPDEIEAFMAKNK